jgi:hypothetical protein
MKDKNGVRIHLVDPVVVTEPGENFEFTGHIMVMCNTFVNVEARNGEERDIDPSHLEVQISKGNAIKRKIRDNRIYHAEIQSQWNGLTGEESNLEMRIHVRPGNPENEWHSCLHPTFAWKAFEYRIKK